MMAIVPWRLVAQDALPAKGDTIADYKAIEGHWKCVASVEKGKAYKVPDIVWIFKDNTVTMLLEGRKQHAGVIKLDASASPSKIEMKLKGVSAANLDQDDVGIYKIEKDKLTVCFGIESAKGKTPTTFTYSAHFPTSSIVLEREAESVKKEEVEEEKPKGGSLTFTVDPAADEEQTAKADPAAQRALQRLKELGASPATLKQIGIQLAWKGEDADLSLVKDLPDLEWLHIDLERQVGAEGLAQLKLQRPVQYLNLGGLSDDVLTRADRLPPCKTLSLSRYKLSDDGFKRLTELAEGIERLEIMAPYSPTEGITDQGLRFVGGIRSLKSLQLFDAGISDDALGGLAGFDKLEALELNECWKIRGPGYASLLPVKSLRTLKAYAMQIDDDAVDALAKLTQLSTLNLQPIEELSKKSLESLQSSLPGTKISVLAYENRFADFVVTESDAGTAETRKTDMTGRANVIGLINDAQKWVGRTRIRSRTERISRTLFEFAQRRMTYGMWCHATSHGYLRLVPMTRFGTDDER